MLLTALGTREITVAEFVSEAAALQPEAAQVLATVLALSGDGEPWALRARDVCAHSAQHSRNYN